MSRDYIPGGNSDFHGFQQFLTEQVTTHGAAWNVPAAMITALNDRNTAYNALYRAIINKEVRTPQQVEAHKQDRVTYTRFLRQLVQGYLVNNPDIPFDEKRAMGLNPRQGRGSRQQIDDIPVTVLRALGGTRVRFEVRIPNTTGRARMHPDSNGVELQVYQSKPGGIAPRADVAIEPTPTPTPVPQPTPMPTPQPMPSREVRTLFRTRAVFTEDIGMPGMMLHVRARYVNTSEPEKNSPWSNEVTVVVS